MVLTVDSLPRLRVFTCVSIYVCLRVCMYVRVHVCVRMYVCAYLRGLACDCI
jgi:hypothetical protein